jgi:ribosome maturation protein SDO1
MKRTTYDPERFNLDIAWIKKFGETYEIVVDPEQAILFKERRGGDVMDVLKDLKIFSDAQRGQIASEIKYCEAFGTNNVKTIAEIILKDGNITLTAEHRKKQIERKKLQIVNYIHQNAIDPRINAPHTPTRIEDALIAVKIHIDEFKSVEDQVKEIIKKLQPIIPIKFEKKQIEIHCDSAYSHQLYAYLKGFNILRNTWGIDNSWTGIVEIPGGLELEFYDKINNITHGSVQTKVIKNE